jgi:hypothetical protein
LWVTRYTPDHTRLVRTKLQIEGRARDLALFNLVMASFAAVTFVIRIEGVAGVGYTAARATVRQKKTERPVRFELSEQTRQDPNLRSYP